MVFPATFKFSGKYRISGNVHGFLQLYSFINMNNLKMFIDAKDIALFHFIVIVLVGLFVGYHRNKVMLEIRQV